VLAEDGKIYCAPYESHESVLCIDPVKRSTAVAAAFDSKGLHLPGFVEAAQGHVHSVPIC